MTRSLTKKPPTGTETALAKVTESQLQDTIRESRSSLVSFRTIFLGSDEEPQYAPAGHHFGWSDMLLESEANVAIEGFRESGKTQYVLRAFPLYALTFPRREWDYIVLIGSTADHAAGRLLDVEDEYLTHPILRRSLVKVKEQSGKKFSADVRDDQGNVLNVRIEAYGKGAAIRGLGKRDRRPKIVIIDDPQDREDAESDTILDKDWRWFLSDVKFLGSRARIFFIGNNLGEKCMIERLFAAAPTLQEIKFECYRVPALDESENAAWPDHPKFTRERLLAEKEDFRRMGQLEVWLRERMCLAIDDETRIFKRDDFRYFGAFRKGEDIRAKCNAWLLVDPAASTDESADYRACVVVGADEHGDWFVLDISYGRYDTATLVDEIFRLCHEWDLREVGIEKGALKSAMEPFLIAEMKKRQSFFNILALEASKKKEERIKMLQPRFRAHTIYFPEDAKWLPELESELLAFTMEGSKGLHDDLIDALAYFEQVVRLPRRMMASGTPLPRRAVTLRTERDRATAARHRRNLPRTAIMRRVH